MYLSKAIVFSHDSQMQLIFSPRPSYHQDNNIWKRAELSLATSEDTGEFRFVIEATVAEGQHGDIAIDDLTLTPGCL